MEDSVDAQTSLMVDSIIAILKTHCGRAFGLVMQCWLSALIYFSLGTSPHQATNVYLVRDEAFRYQNLEEELLKGSRIHLQESDMGSGWRCMYNTFGVYTMQSRARKVQLLPKYEYTKNSRYLELLRGSTFLALFALGWQQLGVNVR